MEFKNNYDSRQQDPGNFFKKIYEDEDILVIDKPAGINSDDFKKRVHRIDKDTSGVLLIAKNDKALEFLQKQFKERKVVKKYLALTVGNLKNEEGEIETLLGRSGSDKRKQKAYLPREPKSEGKRLAVTKYRVLQRFENYASGDNFLPKAQNYDLIELEPKTGRKHQIRAHLVYLNHPLAGDKLYRFKNQPAPKGLTRQFLHASYLKITMPNGKTMEFSSELPKELNNVLENI